MTQESEQLVTPEAESKRPAEQSPDDHGAPVINIGTEVDPVDPSRQDNRPAEQSPGDHGAPVEVIVDDPRDPVDPKNQT